MVSQAYVPGEDTLIRYKSWCIVYLKILEKAQLFYLIFYNYGEVIKNSMWREF
jgi:hypothetical protein